MSKKEQTKASVRKRGIMELIGGIVLAAIGAFASKASYDMAKPGQTYTMYTGIIALGVVYGFKGLYDIAFPAGFGKKRKSLEEPVESAKDTDEKDIVKEED